MFRWLSCVAVGERNVTLLVTTCVAPDGSRAMIVARAWSTCMRASNLRAFAERRSLTVVVCPPATANEPVASVNEVALRRVD